MVTNIVRAMTYDVMRAETTKDTLPKNYPAALSAYAKSAKEAQLESDLSAVVEIIGSDESVVTAMGRLIEEKNAYAVAIAESLKEVRDFDDDSTALGQQVVSIREAGAQYMRAFDRELQTLLMIATGEDSPIVQIARQPQKPLDTSKLPGIPSIQVNTSLLGGSRLFYEGRVTDQSWRARLMQVLHAVN